MTRKRSIRVEGLGGVDALPALRDGPLESQALLVLAPGAGVPATSPFMARLAKAIAAGGTGVLRFDFPYQVRGKKAPDRAPVLDAAWAAAVRYAIRREPEAALFVGGKSMGGRYSTHLLASGETPARGGILFGYPLHRPGKPDELRDAHLKEVNVPLLFFGGTRDSLARIDLVEQTVSHLENAELVVYQDASHNFDVPKRTGSTQDEIIGDMARRSVDFIRNLT